MPDLPDFPSWVAEAEKWERAIRKDERAKAAQIVLGLMQNSPDAFLANCARVAAALAIEGKANG